MQGYRFMKARRPIVVAFIVDGQPAVRPERPLVPLLSGTCCRSTAARCAFVANGAYDTFLSLYRGGFNASNARTNLVDLNDDAYNGAYNGFNTGYLTDVSAFADDLVPGVV